MRIRSKPWAKPELEACPFYIKNPNAVRGDWENQFTEKKPLRLELGCGKGGFIAQEAPANPDYNYVAMDIKNEMLVLAKRKLEAAYTEKEMQPDNVRICIQNISYIRESFSPQDRVDRIYINFCNPWPRGKHKKRRLTHPRQLVQYRTFLDGDVWFKTDDDLLFEESLEHFEEAGFKILTISRDLHSEPDKMYFQTEHEHMFDAEGKKIKFLIAKPDLSVKQEDLEKILILSERKNQ